MGKCVISITREFGSLGRPIAKKMAELMNINYYDRDIVEQTAKEMHLPVSEISDREESAKNYFAYMGSPLGIGNNIIRNSIFETQKQIIMSYYEQGSCIVVGRCSDYIFKDLPDHFSIYIYAPYMERIKNCVEVLHMNQEEAAKALDSVDKARYKYHMKYAGYPPNMATNKNIMIDSSIFGVDKTAEILCGLIKQKYDI